MSTLWQDVRYSLRALGKRPVYALVTFMVLALAIGANATVFSVFDGFFLRPLPYPHGDRLVTVYNTYPRMNLTRAGTSIPDYLDRRAQARSLEDLAIYTGGRRTLGGAGSPEELSVVRASPSLFGVLEVAPLIGRGFTEQEATPGNDAVAVLSYRLWSTRFGRDPAAVGRDIRLDGARFRIVGVMPEGFGFPNRAVDVWVPFAFTPQQASDKQRGFEFSSSIGRLRPGATIERLDAEMDAIVRRNVELGRERGRDLIDLTGFTGRAQSLRDSVVGNLQPSLWTLQGIVLAVLLIACANVANLQLARAVARRKELSVRAALGADRRRLARLMLIESLVLAVAGAAGGLGLALGGLELVRVLGLDRAGQGFPFVIDLRVLGFTAGAALVAALASGLLPLVALVRDDLVSAVREAGRLGSGDRGAQGFRNALVVVQIAIGLALLVGAGLLTKSFYALQREGPGFDAEHVWTARVALPSLRYAEAPSEAHFFEQALSRLRALPGVTAAGYTSDLPFSGGNDQGSIVVEGYATPAGASPPHARVRSISEGYLPSLGIRVVEGRNFAAEEPERVAIVDENLATKYWPGGSALGRRIRSELMDPGDRWYTIVGVVPAVKDTSLAQDSNKETVYWFYKQRPDRIGQLTLRTTLPAEDLTRAANDVVHRIDPELALYDVRSMGSRIAASLGPQRTPAVLTLVFAAVAFTLAVVGIYGVLTWAVTQRFGEIGVRVALGAGGGDIVGLILKQGGRLIAIGLAFGLAGAAVLGRLMASQIYDVNPLDPAVFSAAAAGLAAAALVASWLPARRASRIDPMRALREE